MDDFNYSSMYKYSTGKALVCGGGSPSVKTRVRLFNVGLHFLAAKVAFSCPPEDRFGKIFWGLMTLGQVESVPNFC